MLYTSFPLSSSFIHLFHYLIQSLFYFFGLMLLFAFLSHLHNLTPPSPPLPPSTPSPSPSRQHRKRDFFHFSIFFFFHRFFFISTFLFLSSSFVYFLSCSSHFSLSRFQSLSGCSNTYNPIGDGNIKSSATQSGYKLRETSSHQQHGL